jgi:O-acetyl-ADP-ribose deacetylase (regulator of RNase III)
MGNIIHQTGDIFTTRARAMGHGVNTEGVMGAGIAAQFRVRFPEMYRQYRVLCQNGDLNVGETFVFHIPGQDQGYFLYNIASQDLPGPHAKMEWLEDGVRAALIHAEKNSIYTIALPRIASGIGGLNESEVEEALSLLVKEYPVDIELWTYAFLN